MLAFPTALGERVYQGKLSLITEFNLDEIIISAKIIIGLK